MGFVQLLVSGLMIECSGTVEVMKMTGKMSPLSQIDGCGHNITSDENTMIYEITELVSGNMSCVLDNDAVQTNSPVCSSYTHVNIDSCIHCRKAYDNKIYNVSDKNGENLFFHHSDCDSKAVGSITHPSNSNRDSVPVDESGGCFGGETMVYVMSDITRYMAAKDISKGVTVFSDKGATTVECVVKLKYSGLMHSIGQTVHLTSYHPLLYQDQPYFAKELSGRTGIYSTFTMTEGYVYDFVLANRGLLCCSYQLSLDSTGTKLLHAATFGHTSQLNKFAHPYFGSEAVVEDLKRCRPTGYEQGCIVLDRYSYQRCESSQLVTGVSSSSGQEGSRSLYWDSSSVEVQHKV